MLSYMTHSHQTTPEAWGPLITPQSTPHKAMGPSSLNPLQYTLENFGIYSLKK